MRADVAKDEEKSGYEFVPPDFDEDAFIHKEMVAFKTTTILFLWAVVAALVSWGAFLLLKGNTKSAWPAGLGICLAFGLMLRPLFKRFADISHFKRMNWVGTAILFFFCWLAFFTVFINPPVSDISPPQVEVSADPPLQAEGQEVRITMLAADNDRLAGDGRPTLTIERNGQPVPTPPFNASANGLYTIPLASPHTMAGNYKVRVTATDGRGHTATAQANFSVTAAELLNIRLPPGNNLTGDSDIRAVVQARPCIAEGAQIPCIRRVLFRPDGCLTADCIVDFEYSDGFEAWYATARFANWKPGVQNGTVQAEFMDHYLGKQADGQPNLIKGGIVPSPGRYTLHVDPPAERKDPVAVPPPPAPTSTVPGYGLMGAALAVLGAAFFLRRRI